MLLIENINNTGIAGLIDVNGVISQYFPNAEIGRLYYDNMQLSLET